MNSKLLDNYKKYLSEQEAKKQSIPQPEVVLEFWDAAAFAVCPDYVLDSIARTMIKSLYTSNKGVCFSGSKGVGKSLNFDIYAKLKREVDKVEIEVWDAPEIELVYRSSGAGIIEKLSKAPILVINDVSAESSQLNDFGTMRNIIGDLLFMRYRAFQTEKKITHISCNAKKETLFERYGSRLEDRMKEMFVFVELIGESRRK